MLNSYGYSLHLTLKGYNMQKVFVSGGIVSKRKTIYDVPGYIAKSPKRFNSYDRDKHPRDTKGNRLKKKKSKKLISYLKITSWKDFETKDHFIDSYKYALKCYNDFFNEIHVKPSTPSVKVLPYTIAVIGGDTLQYRKFLSTFPKCLHPAFIKIDSYNQGRGYHFSDSTVLDYSKNNVHSIIDIIYRRTRAIHPNNIFIYNNLKFILK